MSYRPDTAFILAAGKGTRLRPYTDTMPKPMVEIAGKSVIRRALEKLRDEGVKEVVINLHHLAPVLQEHLKEIQNPKIIFSFEENLLDSGGGIKKALSNFGQNPFYIINGDALWDDKNPTALSRLSYAWDDKKMDLLLLLQPVDNMPLTRPVGDYDLNKNGAAIRQKDKNGAYMFAGIRIAHPRIFENTPNGEFPFLSLMDEAEKNERLYAIAHDDAWYHISTPEDLVAVDAHFKNRKKA